MEGIQKAHSSYGILKRYNPECGARHTPVQEHIKKNVP